MKVIFVLTSHIMTWNILRLAQVTCVSEIAHILDCNCSALQNLLPYIFLRITIKYIYCESSKTFHSKWHHVYLTSFVRRYSYFYCTNTTSTESAWRKMNGLSHSAFFRHFINTTVCHKLFYFSFEHMYSLWSNILG